MDTLLFAKIFSTIVVGLEPNTQLEGIGYALSDTDVGRKFATSSDFLDFPLSNSAIIFIWDGTNFI